MELYVLSHISSFEFVYDSTEPTVSIESSRGNSGFTSNDESIDITFTLSEESSNFLAADVTVSSGSISSFQGSGTTYTATFLPSHEGTASLSVSSSSFSDEAGNSNTASEIFTWTYDVTRPTFTMTSSLGSSGFLTNNPTFDLVITASEFVNDFSVSGVDVESVDKSAFASSDGTVFTTALNYTEDGNHYLVIDANAASDMAGNQNTMSDIFEWTYDATSPTATILAAEGTSGFISNDDIIRLTFITSETSDFGESSIETIGGNLNSFTSVDSTTYGANFVPFSTGSSLNNYC